MKISNKVIEQLGRLIAGDTGVAPYRTGPELVQFYNECGFDDVYGEGFPSRWRYSSDRIGTANGSDSLRIILEEFVDPRRYGGEASITNTIVETINKLINIDGYALIKNGALYQVADTKGNIVKPEVVKSIGHEFATEQIEKCNQKILSGDYNGAITNSRSLLEAVLLDILEKAEGTSVKNDGNVIGLWTRCKKILKVNHSKEDVPDYIFQILSGLDSIVNGLAGFSNNAGDRHANKFTAHKHHARLAVNSAMTICDYLIELSQVRANKK